MGWSTALPAAAIDQALGGFQRIPTPPAIAAEPQRVFHPESRELIPALLAEVALFDFGRRRWIDGTRHSFVANVAFTGVHQKLIFTAVALTVLGGGRVNAARKR